MTNKKKTSTVDPEYGVDSRYQTARERKQDAIALMEARLEKIRKLPKEQVLRAKLMQLKLNMENYLEAPGFDQRNHFALFLETYVDTLYAKRSEFAKDINETPGFLSKVINRHREPKEEFILKLMVHSEKVFRRVGGFRKQIWYQVYLHEKLAHTMSNQRTWGPEIEKQVKLTESLVK